MQMGTDIEGFVRRIAEVCPEFSSVWLIGSRANNTAHETSDWDLLAFGNKKALACIRKHRELHRPDVDFLVVTNGDVFINAWGNCDKTGSLSQWEWKQKSDVEAEYTEVKSSPGANYGNVALKRRLGLRIWAR